MADDRKFPVYTVFHKSTLFVSFITQSKGDQFA